MTTSAHRRSGLAALAVAGLVGSSLLLTAAPASADEGFAFERIAGDNRYDTSALIADRVESDGNAILANGQRGQFADALSANYLAGELDAPVLLTRKGATPDEILEQLEEDDTETVTVVGGENVVSEEQVEELEDAGYDVERVAGDNRYASNAKIIEAGGAAPTQLALVVTGSDFADALAAGPLAQQGHPIVLAGPNGVPAGTVEAMKDAGIQQVAIVGGESVVSENVEEGLEDAGLDVAARLAGPGRAATSVEVAKFAVTELDFTDTAINVASGDPDAGGADALSTGVLSGQQGRPMLVTQSTDNPSTAITDYLTENGDKLTAGMISGGPSAVPDSVAEELRDVVRDADPTPEPEPDPDPQPPAPNPPNPPQAQGDIDVLTSFDDRLHLSGSTVEIEVEVTDASGDPVDGVEVDFTAEESGSYLDQFTGTDESDSVVTANGGRATFSYDTPEGTLGYDQITAVVDSDDPELDGLEAFRTVGLVEGIYTVTDGAGDVREVTDAPFAAIFNARDGDTITIEGDVTRNWRITKQVTLVGDDATVSNGLSLEADGARVEGFSFTAPTDRSQDPAVTVYSDDAVLEDNLFDGPEVAIALADAEAPTLEGNDFVAERPRSDVFVDARFTTIPRSDLERFVNDGDQDLDNDNTFDPDAVFDQGFLRPAVGVGNPRTETIRILEPERGWAQPGGRFSFEIAGDDLTVRAKALDRFGDPLVGRTVSFALEDLDERADDGTNHEFTTTAETDAQGIATFVFDDTDVAEGIDDITVGLLDSDGFEGNTRNAYAQVQFAEGIATVNPGPGQEQYAKLNHAVGVADGGDAIEIEGVFDDDDGAVIDRPLTITGVDRGLEKARVEYPIAFNGDEATFDEPSAIDNVDISYEPTDPNFGAAILAIQAPDVTVSDSNVTGGRTAVRVAGTGASLIDNAIRSDGTGVLIARGAEETVITGNDFATSAADAFYVRYLGERTAEQLELVRAGSDNTFAPEAAEVDVDAGSFIRPNL